MFFNSTNFKTIEAGVNIAWLEQQIHSQNIANIETPDYKAKQLVFDDVLNEAMSAGNGGNISVSVIEDPSSVLQDGNNVNLEKENIELYKSYAQYSMLLDKAMGQFNNITTVLNSNMS